jgi:enoyl-[acyl-carrier protein] reductase II
MRVIRNAYVDDWERRPEEIQPFPAQMVASAAAGVLSLGNEEIDPDRQCMPAGQGVGGIREVLPAVEIVRRMLTEAKDVYTRVGTQLG